MTNIPEIDQQGSDRVIRTSELTTAQMCMRKLGYSRSYGRSGPNELMLGGLAIDDALTEHNTQRINGREGFDVDVLVEYAVTRFRERKQQTREKWGEIRGSPEPDLERMMRLALPLYMEQFDPICTPVETQGVATFVDEETGLTLVGHVDLVRRADVIDGHGGHEIISDYKFTKKTAKQMNAATSQQMYAYALLRGEPPYHVELVLLRRLKTGPKLETTSHFVTDEERQSVVHVLRSVGALIENSIWPMANPSEWFCTPKWCDHWNRCRGKVGGPLPLPGEKGWDGSVQG